MKQLARNLTDDMNGFLNGYRYLLRDWARVLIRSLHVHLPKEGKAKMAPQPDYLLQNQIVLRFRSAVPKYRSQFVSVPEGIWNPGLSRLGASGFRAEN